MNKFIFGAICLFLIGCSEANSPECLSDLDCRNGFRCDEFFMMCEPDSSADSGSNQDAAQFDGGMERPDASSGDAGEIADAAEFDARPSSGDSYLRFNGGTMISDVASWENNFEVSFAIRFDALPNVGDVLFSSCNGCFQIDVVWYSPTGAGSESLYLSCAFRDRFGTQHRLFGDVALLSGSWHDVSCVRSGIGMAFMSIDGVRVSSHDSIPITVPSEWHPFSMGPFHGNVDSFVIQFVDRRHRYLMDEGSGLIVHDSSLGNDFAMIDYSTMWGE